VQGEKPGRPHSHDREEIIVFVRGSAVAVLEGERTEVGAGDVVVIPPGTLHTFEKELSPTS
jgi:mannose-6-phosphate isomerase-like protein (cupin superfamily)